MNNHCKKFILAAGLLLLAVACQKEQGRVLTATFEPFDNASKAYIDAEYYACWESTDIVKINGTNHNVTITPGSEGRASSAQIQLSDNISGDILAFYPYNRISDDMTTVDFPHVQEYAERDGHQIIDNPMAAYCPAGDRELRFRNLGALLEVSFPNTTKYVKAIQVQGIEDQMLCGKAQLRRDNTGQPSLSRLTDGCNSVTLHFEQAVSTANDRSFFIVLPAGANFETITIAALLYNNADGTSFHGSRNKTGILDQTLPRNHVATIRASNLDNLQNADNYPADWLIFYEAPAQLTSTNFDLHQGQTRFGANIALHNWNNGVGALVFNDLVTTIGDNAFDGCSTMTSVTIPQSTTTIGGSAFQNCTSLQNITLPEGVTSIGNSAFQGCTSLQSINIPEGLTSISNSTFQDCTSLQSINLPEGLTSIGDDAFSYCSALQSPKLPESLTSLGSDAFHGCLQITSIDIPQGVTTIPNSAFRNCGLGNVTIRGNVTNIGSLAFSNCNKLHHIYCYAESAPTLNAHAFEYCTQTIILSVRSGLDYSSWESAYPRFLIYDDLPASAK